MGVNSQWDSSLNEPHHLVDTVITPMEGVASPSFVIAVSQRCGDMSDASPCLVSAMTSVGAEVRRDFVIEFSDFKGTSSSLAPLPWRVRISDMLILMDRWRSFHLK